MKTEPDSLEDKSPSDSIARPESYRIKGSIWQRWMAWNGSFLVLSILLHLLLLGGATVIVVRVVEGRKEKLKFTAPPPSPAGAVEHKVKVSKKAAAVPAISKRITSTAANASIALPAMATNSFSTPDGMSSVTSGLGSGELGSGVAGMAAMPLTGMTAFGFRGTNVAAGLVGHLYDLSQTPDRKPTGIKDEGTLKNPKLLDSLPSTEQSHEMQRILSDQSKLGKRADLVTESVQRHAALINNFIAKKWDESLLQPFYRSKDPIVAFQFYIVHTSAKEALEAFGVSKEVTSSHFLIHYKGFVKAPKSGIFRFRVQGGGSAAFFRFNNENVLALTHVSPLYNLDAFKFKNPDPPADKKHTLFGYDAGKWMQVQAGQKYPMEVLLESNDSNFYVCVMIEDKHPDAPYPKTFLSELYPQDPITFRYPVFALRAGIPITPYDKTQITSQKPPPSFSAADQARWRPWEPIPDSIPEPLIFPGTK